MLTTPLSFTFTGPASWSIDLDRLNAAAKSRTAPAVPAALLANWRRAATTGAQKLERGSRRLSHRMVERLTLGWNLAEQEQIDTLGPEQYLEQQLDPESLNDFGLEQALVDNLPTLTMSPAEIAVTYGDELEVPFFDLELAQLYRAVYSPRQLYERMVIFWTDHFNINFFSDFGPYFKPRDDREVVRRHALGSFPELLRASAQSAAMLSYLTNDSNVRDHPNENYARELMELHTLGVDGGYTEADVKEVARCFTGWTFQPPQAGLPFGDFLFDPARHDFGPKTVLGQNLPANRGIEDGEDVLDLLAHHPSTARFLSRKLLQYFWGYEPDERTVDKVATAYLDSGGDVPTVLREVFRWWRVAKATPKLKRPFHLVVSTLRGLFAELSNPYFALAVLFNAGHLPFTWEPPNGFPDSDGYWSGFVLPRLNFGSIFLLGEDPLATLDLPFLDPNLSPTELVDLFELLLFDQGLSPATRTALTDYLSGPRNALRIAEALGLAVGSPEFQNY